MGSSVSAPTNVDDTDNTVPNDYADKKSMVVATSPLPRLSTALVYSRRIHSEAVKSPAISSDDHFASDIDHGLVHRALDMDQNSKVPLINIFFGYMSIETCGFILSRSCGRLRGCFGVLTKIAMA